MNNNVDANKYLLCCYVKMDSGIMASLASLFFACESLPLTHIKMDDKTKAETSQLPLGSWLQGRS